MSIKEVGGRRLSGMSGPPEFQVLEDLLYDRRFVDEADHLHLRAAMGALQRIDFPHLLDALAPGFRGIFFR